MGRTSKRSPERREAILNALRAGNTRRAAAAFAEVDQNTFYRWLDDDGTFRDDVVKAEGDAEVRFLTQVAKAATNGTWTAAAWWLERRHPEDYALRQRIDSRMELTGRDGGPVEIIEGGWSDHERMALKAAITRELAAREETPA